MYKCTGRCLVEGRIFVLPDCHGDTVRGERASGHYFNVLFTGVHLFDVWTFLVEYTEIGFEVEWVSRETSDKE